MPPDGTKSHLSSDVDFYELLGVNFESSQKDIDRAWRKTALKYHPDKVGNDTAAKDKFHLAQIGYDLLSDPSSKSIYDNARNARLQRKRQAELFEGRRRQMKDDLEAREKGVKRAREEEECEEERLEREIRRLAEDGKRRRKEREDTLREQMDLDSENAQVDTSTSDPRESGANYPGTATSVSEIDRTVKARWPLGGAGESMTAYQITQLFSVFGPVENTILLAPKMLRLSNSKKKQLGVVCMVQFTSVVGAHAAVEDFGKQQGDKWRIFDSVYWASNKEPDFIGGRRSDASKESEPPSLSNPLGGRKDANPFAHLRNGNTGSAETAQTANGHAKPAKPSFTSFATISSQKTKPPAFSSGPGSGVLSLEEVTMIRLKEAEKRRLAAEIQRQDEEADASKTGT